MKWAVEYWIGYGENGDVHDLHIIEGKHWRRWKQHIGEEGVIRIERVRTEYDECGTYERECETLWESE